MTEHQEETAQEREARIARAKALTAPKYPQKRIAIMICKKSAEGCTGAACFWAYDSLERSFAQYRDSTVPVKLWGFFHCGGCDIELETDAGLRKKLERLVEEGVETVHLGVCMRNYCPSIQAHVALVESYGIRCEIGTH